MLAVRALRSPPTKAHYAPKVVERLAVRQVVHENDAVGVMIKNAAGDGVALRAADIPKLDQCAGRQREHLDCRTNSPLSTPQRSAVRQGMRQRCFAHA